MKLGIIGGGAWGTALAQVAATGGRETLLWALEQEVVESVNSKRENSLFLAGVPLSAAIRATADLGELDACDAWLVVTPAQHMRAVLERARGCDKPLVLCSKGIEEASGQLLHQVAKQCCPRRPDRNSVGSDLRPRGRQGTADRGDPGGRGSGAGRAAARADRSADLPHLPFRRPGRRRNRRSGQERARDRMRRGRGQGARPERAGGADRPRLCRNDPLRPGAWGKARDARGPQRPRRSGADLLVGQLAQLFARARASARAARPRNCSRTARPSRKGAFTAPVLARLAREKGVDMPIVDAVDALIAGRADVDQALVAPSIC